MNLKDVINRIRIIRDIKNLSARELSLKIDKNDAYINRLESSRSFDPSVSTLLEIIAACGSTPAEFFYYDINQYEKDKEIISLLQTVKNDKKKQAVIDLLKS